MPTRYAICGLSNRAVHEYALPLLGSADAEEDYSGFGDLVAIVELDRVRGERFLAATGALVPLYQPSEVDRMLEETRPEVVIVAGPDFTHADYAVAALEHGLDVIVEKPLAHTAEAARRILDAEAKSPGTVIVAHNARYEPSMYRLRELVQSGTIGRVVAVDVVEGLDSYHGASFFTRWNRQRKYSGGLAVTKGCHTLDSVCWVLDDSPRTVFSAGGLNFYGPASPHRPLNRDGAPLSAEVELAHNPYSRRWLAGRLPAEQELFTGKWQRLGYEAQYPAATSRTIFDAEIDVEDTYSSVLTFTRGSSMTYSLCFSLPWEGLRIGITGTEGRIETEWIVRRDDPAPATRQQIRVERLFGASEIIEVAADPRGHDLADSRIRHDLFRGPSRDSLAAHVGANALQGALAVAAGEAMWRSVESGEPVNVPALLGIDASSEWDRKGDAL